MEGIILAPSARRMFTYDITHYTRQIFQSSSGEEGEQCQSLLSFIMTDDLVWLEPQTPKEIIEELKDDYKIEYLYPLYSGGQDSGSVVDFVHKNYPEMVKKTVFTCTGIGSPMTREFAVEYAKEKGWELESTWARKPYWDIVKEVGFRGMGGHRILMGYLKFQSWYYYMRPKLKAGEKAAFVSGVRKSESMARSKIKFYSKTPIDKNATLTFVKPFLYKNGTQLQEYMIKEGVKKSPAYEFFNKSGECWCGAQSHAWELKMLEAHDPFIFNTIKWYEKQLQIVGSPEAKRHPHWGQSVGAENAVQQTTFGDFEINEDYCGESCGVS